MARARGSLGRQLGLLTPSCPGRRFCGPMRASVVLLTFAVLATAAPTVLAGVDNCSVAASPGSGAVKPYTVPQSNTWQQLNFAPSCGANNPLYISTAPACLAFGIQPGELCGWIVPAGGSITCQWLPALPGTVVDLYVGFDADANGHLWQGSWPMDNDPPGYRNFPINTPMTVTNNAGVAARFIAYPVSLLVGGSALDSTIVSCR